MKNYRLIVLFIICVLLITNTDAQNKRKLAQTGFKFLSVSTDARVSGMAGAQTSVFGSSNSMLYNPAGMAEIYNTLDITVSQTQWIADIDYISGTIAFNPFSEYYGVFGVSVVAVDYGWFYETVRAENEAGYLNLGTYKPSALSVGVGYARMLSDKFGIGGNVKYVRQSIMNDAKIGVTASGYNKIKLETDAIAYDFGLIYKTGFKSLNIGMSVRNFSEEVKYIEEGFELPLTFRIGASMNIFDFLDIPQSEHSFLLAVDAVNPRDFEEQISFGVEYTFMELLSLRGGYNFPQDEGGFSAGIGLIQSIGGYIVGFDYSHSPFGVFDNVHRFSLRFSHK